MISSRAIIVSSSIFGSIYLFTTSLKEINKYLLYDELDNYKNKCFSIINGLSFALSTTLLTFCCVKTIDYQD